MEALEPRDRGLRIAGVLRLCPDTVRQAVVPALVQPRARRVELDQTHEELVIPAVDSKVGLHAPGNNGKRMSRKDARQDAAI